MPLVVAAVERPHIGHRVVPEHAAHHAGVCAAEVVVAHRPPDALVPNLHPARVGLLSAGEPDLKGRAAHGGDLVAAVPAYTI